MLSLCCCSGFGLVAASGGSSLVAAVRLLIAVASFSVDTGSQGAQASIVVV